MSLLNNGARLFFGKVLPKVPYPVIRGPLRGSWYILGATAGESGGVSVHVGLQEVEQSRCLANSLCAGQVFFDVGANVGFYTLLGSRLVRSRGRVVAFEPVPRNLAFLYRHVRLNRADNVTILPLACADALSNELFIAGENHALGRLEGSNRDPERASSQSPALLVATISLDAAAEKLGLRPDVIKIDVEGAELRVLEGAANILTQVRPVLLLSVHSDQLRKACLTHLSERGYQIEPLNSSTNEGATEFLAKPSLTP
jgi:FkbM family methyltransferase